MPSLGGWEWVILAVVALVLFGGTKLATFGKNAGKAIREFKEEAGTGNSQLPKAAEEPKPEPDDSKPA
jgi:sec-independent protein translocase protein TatA